MIEQTGRIVAVDQGSKIWVETEHQNTCGKCSAQTGCGQGLLSKMTSSRRNLICVRSDRRVRIGDEVVLGIHENTLLRSSLLSYGLPVLTLLTAVILADSLLGFSEPGVIVAAAIGLALGFGLVRLHGLLTNDHRGYQPVLLEVIHPEREAGIKLTPATGITL